MHGLVENGGRLSRNEVTLMECLRLAGYQTFGAGKMHFTPQWSTAVPADELRISVDLADAVDPQPESWDFPYYGFEDVMLSEDNRAGPYADYLRSHGLDPWGDPHSFTFPQSVCVRSIYPERHHQTAWITDRSLEFLDGRNTRRPFFLWTSYVHPHHPFDPPAPFDTMYEPANMPLPLWDPSEVAKWPLSYKAIYMAHQGGHEAIGMSSLTDAQWQLIKAFYFGMISFIDKQVGRLINILQEKGWIDDTVVIFTADHGELMGDHHLLFKGAIYDSVTNVPLVISRPRDVSERSSEAIIETIDLMPTVLEFAGVARPPTAQGMSFATILTESSQAGREAALVESPGGVRTAWTREGRITWHGEGKHGELYNHLDDPDCFRNLWDEPGAGDLQQHLLGRLIALMAGNINPGSGRICLC
jgi:arylsulfatase A-like enzyme